jgi:cytochrome b pre-mRNA-processing protein 3
VTQARARGFYAHCGVPDTPEGRFETIALHAALVLLRLGRTGRPGWHLGRALTEAFAADMDDNFREMAAGDLAVPKHVNRAVAALHDRHAAYGTALAAPDDGPLAAALEARLDGAGATEGLAVAPICAYIRRAVQHLDRLADDEVLAGRITWPHIEAAGRDGGAVGA